MGQAGFEKKAAGLYHRVFCRGLSVMVGGDYSIILKKGFCFDHPPCPILRKYGQTPGFR